MSVIDQHYLNVMKASGIDPRPGSFRYRDPNEFATWKNAVQALCDAVRGDERRTILEGANIKPSDYEKLMTNAVGLELAGERFVVFCQKGEHVGYLKAFVKLNEGKAFEVGG